MCILGVYRYSYDLVVRVSGIYLNGSLISFVVFASSENAVLLELFDGKFLRS